MPRRPRTHNRADVKQAIELMEMMGKIVTAVKYHPDGTFRVMTKDHEIKEASAESEHNPWDTVLQQ